MHVQFFYLTSMLIIYIVMIAHYIMPLLTSDILKLSNEDSNPCQCLLMFGNTKYL